MNQFQVSKVANVPISITSLESAVHLTLKQALDGTLAEPLPIRLVNAYCLALSARDTEYQRVLGESGLNLPDGAHVARLLRMLGHSDAQQVRGPTYFHRVLEAGIPQGVRHYFFGTDEATLQALKQRIRNSMPSIEIAGTMAPPFASVEAILTAETVRSIRKAEPSIVWVGLGTPKQDHITMQLARELRGIPCIGVGAAFDFFAGTKREAPRALRALGLEWLFRLASEPGRLWRRYLFGNLEFIRLAWAELLRLKLPKNMAS